MHAGHAGVHLSRCVREHLGTQERWHDALARALVEKYVLHGVWRRRSHAQHAGATPFDDGGLLASDLLQGVAQNAHVVEADGTCSADRVYVSAKKRGHVRVHVRVLPHESVDVVEKGTELHEELVRGLTAVCGDKRVFKAAIRKIDKFFKFCRTEG